MKRFKRMMDRTFVLYLILGLANFIFCTGLMFFLFNVGLVNEFVAPLINYGLGSIIWFLGCKYLLFPGIKSGPQQYIRFAIEVLICYAISYYLLAPPIAGCLLNHDVISDLFAFGGSAKVSANCEMTIGVLLYALLNYYGQRYFVFSDRFEYHKKQYDAK